MSILETIGIRNTLLCAMSAAFCLGSTCALAQQPILTAILPSAPNFRDLAGISASNGGTGFADTTSHNGVMRTGVFYRSNMLHDLDNADLAIISTLNIGRDIDLRTPDEYNANPDLNFGAILTHINIDNTKAPTPPPPLSSPVSAAVAYMESGYVDFVTKSDQRAAIHTVLITLANDSFPDLFHCSGGKDRTGWTAMLLQSIAGVSPTTIMSDYLATNTYTAAFIQSQLVGVPPAEVPTATALLGVQSSYLQTGLDQINASYGSMYAYLTQGLGLTQADIYVLRAKMVDYLTLPGQSGFVGNAAAGAALLNALQNSPLSGHYTAYNYYLQSAIDAGTLGGIQTQVGGQVHADASAFLLREPALIDDAIMPYASGRGLGGGQTSIWLASLGGYFGSDGRFGVADSSERSAGTVMGVTHRFDNQASADLGIGYVWGSVGSAGGSVNLNTVLATLGGRYGFSSLEVGPYVAARATGGWVDYESTRSLGGGLGTARGSTTGGVFSGRADLGDVFPVAPFTVTPQAGVRVAHVGLGHFTESGSDLALAVPGASHTAVSALVDLDVSLDRQQLGDWTVAPDLSLGYERILGSSRISSTGEIYGLAVTQYSAFASHDLVKAGLGVTAQRSALSVRTGVNGAIGDGARSTGISAHLTIGYSL